MNEEKLSELKILLGRANELVNDLAPSEAELTKSPVTVSLLLSLEKLAKKTSLSKEALENLYDLETEPFKIVKLNIKGTKKEVTVKMTYLALLGFEHILNKKIVLSSELKNLLMDSELGVDNAFGQTISKELGRIQRRGKIKSRKLSYYLSRPGEVKAISILKEIIANLEE